MTQTLDHGALDDAALPARLVSLMRPELPGLTEEIITGLRRNIPEYARTLDGAHAQVLRAHVETHVAAFVDLIADPSTVPEAHDEAARRLGRLEAHEGRSMDCLQAAFRIGGQVAWRRIMREVPRYDLPAPVMARLADVMFGYIDRLAALAMEGYVQATESPAAMADKRRRELLRLVLEGPSVPASVIREKAQAAGWTVPEEVVLVAVRPRARCVRAALDGDVLADVDGPAPHLLVPGPFSEDRLAMLRAALPDQRIAVGLPVAPPRAADSLRWARQALALSARGVIDDGPAILCENHLVTLWLLVDVPLLHQLARRELAPMAGLTSAQRDRLTETLLVWLVNRGTASELGDRLHIHPQTVRYRLRQLDQLFGDRLRDPECRFGIEVVLRAMRLWPADT
ncbi:MULTISPECIES: helix-turn-helix domain-containing protein [Actinomadura]|uniref:PucR family transcriptional regulator n=1 Tax=Actinomadura miaoliensis TaxID=430685 RepID=A0ABP7UW70_9ACTN